MTLGNLKITRSQLYKGIVDNVRGKTKQARSDARMRYRGVYNKAKQQPTMKLRDLLVNGYGMYDCSPDMDKRTADRIKRNNEIAGKTDKTD